jgi:haloacetate dehalogenase
VDQPFVYEALDLADGTVAYHRSGTSDELVVLLHGWPETARCWAPVVSSLSRTFTVVAPDLPGYAGTTVPGGDKRATADALSRFVTSLGFDRAMVAGHDRGARVAHRWALDHPDQVTRLAVLDVIPMAAMIDRLNPATARAQWHWFFHQSPVAQRTIEKSVRTYLWPFLAGLVDSGAIDRATAEHYVDAYERPGRVPAFLADYRASFGSDLDADARDAEAGHRLGVPLLALWGSSGPLADVDVLAVWRRYADDVRARAVDCGHYLPEERPADVGRELDSFFSEGVG